MVKEICRLIDVRCRFGSLNIIGQEFWFWGASARGQTLGIYQAVEIITERLDVAFPMVGDFLPGFIGVIRSIIGMGPLSFSVKKFHRGDANG